MRVMGEWERFLLPTEIAAAAHTDYREAVAMCGWLSVDELVYGISSLIGIFVTCFYAFTLPYIY